MKNLFRISILFLLVAGSGGCKEARFINLQMETPTKQLTMDVTKNKLLGLLQQGHAISGEVKYRLALGATFGRTVTVNITAGEGWGVAFANGVYTLPENSGLFFNEPAGDNAFTIQIVEDPDFVRASGDPPLGPVKSGMMPINISILDENGEQIIFSQDALNVFEQDKVLLTVGDLKTKWKLDIGDAFPFDPLIPEENMTNHAIITATLAPNEGNNQIDAAKPVEDFQGIGVPGVRVKKDCSFTGNITIQWKEYVVTDEAYGVFFWWPAGLEIPNGEVSPGTVPEWPGQGGVGSATVYDFTTGDQINEPGITNVLITGANAKDLSNTNNPGNKDQSNIITGEGDERVVDVQPSSSSWNMSNLSTFPKTGTYIVQWDIVNKRPIAFPQTTYDVYKIGKLRLFLEVVDAL